MLHPSQATTRCLRNIPTPTLKNTPRARTASTLPSFAPESSSPMPDLQIFDIFDAPSRLGEAREFLHKKRSSHSSYAPSPRPSSSSPKSSNSSRSIKPLPAPIIFDGPAHPTHIRFISYRSRKNRTTSNSASETHSKATAGPFTLPPPEIFDGPSRLKPYVQRDENSSAVRPILTK